MVHNDTASLGGDGSPLLSIDECWRPAASNETLHRALAEVTLTLTSDL